MKQSRTAAGLHITCLTISLILLFNGFVLLVPLGSPSFSATFSFPLDPQRNSILSSTLAQSPDNQSELVGQLTWQQQKAWTNLNSRTEFSVSFDQGQLTRETMHFTNIHPEPMQIAVEDYDPANCPFEDYIWTDEEAYMSFRINGTEPVRVDGFWIYLRGESQGIFRYRVYGAEPGIQAATFVNTSAPLTGWIEVPISPTLEPGEEYWFWIDTNESALVLDPLSTYANTFYFGLGRAFGATTDTRINWVYCRDDANPDEDDEGDCYGHFSSWSYRARDLFLNVSILPESTNLYPTDLDMRVNGNSVSNLVLASDGLWDSEEYEPPIVLDGDARSYRVLVDWSGFYQWSVNFDVWWEGLFIDAISVMSTPTSMSLDANWLLTIIVDFPPGIENQTIVLTLPPDWTLKFLHRNTLLYTEWVLEGSHLVIMNAEDGLWHIYCLVPVSSFSFYWWIILCVVVILTLALVVLFIFYRQQILLPRQRRHRRDLQALADSFYDIHKIRRILLIHKETGLCLLDPIVDRKMRANLVSALIQAITAFGLNLTETEEADDLMDDTSSLQQITYRDFHIIVHDGQDMRNALIFKQPPSSQLGKRLEEFTARFEDQYRDILDNWAGRLNLFDDAIGLVEEFFFISLRLPHIIHSELASHLSLTATERDLFALAKTLKGEDGTFTIFSLVEKYLQEKGVQRIEVFEALFRLREKGILVPMSTEFPYEFGNNAST